MTRRRHANGGKNTSRNTGIRIQPGSYQRRNRSHRICRIRGALSPTSNPVTARVRYTCFTTLQLADDCLEHLHPRFCPQKLLNYNSQGTDPSDFAFLQSLHPTDLNVHIHETDTSRRIPDWWLEQLWGIPSQGRVLCLPPWAKRDDIIQRMIDKEDVDETMYHGQYDKNRRQSSPHRTMSLTPDWGAEESDIASPKFERDLQKEQKEIHTGFGTEQTSPSNRTETTNAHATYPAGPSTDLSGTQSYPAVGAPIIQGTRHGRNRKSTAPSVGTIRRAPRAQTSGIKKRPAARKTAAMKAATSGSIRTRAQGVLKFLALDSNGHAISLPGH